MSLPQLTLVILFPIAVMCQLSMLCRHVSCAAWVHAWCSISVYIWQAIVCTRGASDQPVLLCDGHAMQEEGPFDDMDLHVGFDILKAARVCDETD